jgi:two-component system nitrate/nitrite response regulator NarL
MHHNGVTWMKKVKLVLIEDNRLFREHLEALLTEEADFELVACYARWQEATVSELVRAVDIFIWDRSGPSDCYIHFFKVLTKSFPNAKVVLIDVGYSEPDIADCLRRGAEGVVLKDASREVLINTIRAVSGGLRVLPPTLSSTLLSRLLGGIQQRNGTAALEKMKLSKREREVAELIAAGFSNKEIATHLNIATFTVKSHVRNVLMKMDVKTRLQVASHMAQSQDFRILPG